MSLGLNDLKKRSMKTESKKSLKETAVEKTAASENRPRGSTARPWTSSGLTKGPKTRKSRAENSDVFMSAEWANDHTSALNAFDMEAPSALARLHDLQINLKQQAVELERKIKRVAMDPLHIVRSVLTFIQK